MILDSFRLDGRVAVVTGGNRGLGQGCAFALAEAGADIALLGRTDPVETAERIAALGRRVSYVPCDLGKAGPGELAAAVDTVVAELGRLDILVNNAGIIRRAPATEVVPADWADVLSVNLDAVFQLSQAAGRVMIAQGSGKIINVASMLSFQGGIRVASYTASKSGVAGLTRLLANEWASKGINVNAIAPGYVATNNTTALRNDATRNREILARIPAGRWAKPEEIGGAAVFLASRASDYVHGTLLPVDGGWLAR